MKEQGKRVQRQSQEDAAFNRMLIWMAGCVVLEGLTLLLRKFYVNYAYTEFGIGLALALSTLFQVFLFAGPVLTVAGALWIWFEVKKGKRGKALALPLALTGAALWLTVASVLCYNTIFAAEMGMTLLCAVPAVVAALAVVWFLYQREFFLCSAVCAAGIVAIWVYRSIYTNHPNLVRMGFALVWAVLALAAAAVLVLRKKEGKVKGVRLLPVGANYLIVLLSCVVAAAAMAVTLLVGVSYAFYVMFALIGWLFCLAVYCTVKLM